MATQLSQTGLEIDSVASDALPTGDSDKVLLYASGSGSDARLYVKAGSNTQKQLGVDIDQYDELDAAPHSTQDEFLVSDNGTEKRVSMANVAAGSFALVSGDIAINSAGAATIQANSVALGTDTTGNYVGTVTGGVGITSTGATTGEGIAHSLSVDAAQPQMTTVGVLGSGSISSGFGAIDIGSSNMQGGTLSGSVAVQGGAATFVSIGAHTLSGKLTAGSVEIEGSAFDINGGTIDGATIATSDITVGSGKTLDVSGGTLTLANDQIAAAKVTGLDGTGLSDSSGVLSVDAAQPQMTTVGVLASGSIASGFGAINIGSSALTAGTGSLAELSISGDLTVNGVTTTVNSTTIQLDDKNIELAHSPDGSEGNDAAVDGGGLTLKSSDSDKTWNWVDSTDAWTSSEHIDMASGKVLKIAGSEVMSATALAAAVKLNNGNWSGTDLAVANGGTGASNASDARDNLGVAIGSDVQAYDAQLDTLSGFSAAQVVRGIADDNLMTVDDADAANGDFAKFTASGLEGRSASEMRSDLSLEPGVDVQAYDAELLELATMASNTAAALADLQNTEVAFLDGAAAGTVANSKAVVYSSAGAVVAKTGSFSAGAEAAALATDGGLAFKSIGATSAGAALFFMEGDDSNPVAGFVSGAAAVNGDGLHLKKNVSSLYYSNMAGTVSAAAGWYDTGNTLQLSSSLNMTLKAASNGAIELGASSEATDAIFYGMNQDGTTDGHELMKWDASENALIFNDENAEILRVGGNATSDYAIDVQSGTANQNKIRASAFVTYSDRNLKKDIAPMADALDKVMALDAVSYKMKNGNRDEIGFIAQDVAKVVPEVCALDAQGVGRGIDYSRMTALLAGAVKTQQAQIENLQKVIANLQK
jgi:hypothetical protein